MKCLRQIAAGLIASAQVLLAQQGDRLGEVQGTLPETLKPPPSPALAPADALKTFQIAEGFRIELFASEPLVQEPVAMTFDEDGRLWVVEMRGFMPNVEGRGEDEPAGRVSILEDTDGDGRADKGTVFLEGLVLPRAVAVVKSGALVADSKKLIYAQDTNADGRADKTEVIDAEYAVGGNPEHSPNGLLRGLDNWFYNAKSKFRYRPLEGRWLKNLTEFRGQWGIAQDDWGRLFYNYNWSQLHGDVAPPNYFQRNPHYTSGSGVNLAVSTNQLVHTIRMNTGINRAYRPGVLDARGRMREFSAAGAPLIYRGDQFPSEFLGNAFVCDPSANIVKRNLVFDQGLELGSQHAYRDREFLASTDERFRPVWLANGPDGALYVADMYRGIIQHRAFMTTHLRGEILSRHLDQPIHLGRIYRIVHEGKPRGQMPKLSQARSAELVELLSHPNAWHRETAQRLLIEREARTEVPKLRELALRGPNPPGRLHALWTLEGLRDPGFAALLPALKEPHPKVQAAAICVIESLSTSNPEGQQRLADELETVLNTAVPEVRFQATLTFGNLLARQKLTLLAGIAAQDAESALFRDAVLSGLAGLEMKFLELIWREALWQRETPGRALFLEALASTILRARRDDEPDRLFALLDASAENLDWRQRAILTGVAFQARSSGNKPIVLARPPNLLTQASGINDSRLSKRIASLLSSFAWPGHFPTNSAARARPLTVTEEKLFHQGRQIYLMACAACHGSDGAGLTPLGPPLAGSDWVTGPPERLARIVLQGMEGPVHVNGEKFEPPRILPNMPSVDLLDSTALAAVLTYIRRDWDNEAEPVPSVLIARVRTDTAGRQTPWTEAELRAVPPLDLQSLRRLEPPENKENP